MGMEKRRRDDRMTTVLQPAETRAKVYTVADLIERLGDVPLDRIWMHPAPGTATEADVIAADTHHDRLCELVEGTLVEKAMGFRESLLACALIEFLRAFVVPRNLGMVTGADGTVRLIPGLVRMPDVAFISWDRLPGRRVPREPMPDLAPDLAVEVLSESNTRREMARKRREYFEAGTRLVWEIDPERRTVAVYTSPDATTLLDASATLDGGAVLPGFSIRVADLFAELDRRG
jgi:Uma2 family endonuclease